MNPRLALVVLSLQILVAGCAALEAPEIEIDRTAAATSDGLYPVRHTRIDEVYAMPGLDLSAYDRVVVAPVTIGHKRDSYELSDAQVERMLRHLNEALEDQLLEYWYELVSVPGRDVLLLDAEIVNLEINRAIRGSTGIENTLGKNDGNRPMGQHPPGIPFLGRDSC